MNELSKLERAVGSFLGAAVGDSMGWPNEDRAHHIRRLDKQLVESGFSTWFRRRGWMAQTFEEPVYAGEYSDDTQLILATGRSLEHENWWAWFTGIELPVWLLYERGGGIALKRAARSWTAGKPPWENPKDRNQYWSAGGNGVCMRILPHVASDARDFSKIRIDVLRNGISTHGHPRALIGAVVYAFALWQSFCQDEMLEFGRLIDVLLREKDLWIEFSEDYFNGIDWLKHFPDGIESYKLLWKSVAKESTDLLEASRSYIKQGALEFGDEALRRIGAFDRNSGAAGTVTACASVFLASRYAASPKQGLRFASSLIGVDTDTIASMTGAVLGALHGREFLNHLAAEVQDSAYIEKIAARVQSRSNDIPKSNGSKVQVPRRALLAFTGALKSASVGDAIPIPDGRRAKLIGKENLNSRRGCAVLWRLATEDGQTLIHSSLQKPRGEKQALDSKNEDVSQQFAVKCFAHDLKKAREFYELTMGLPLTDSSSSALKFAGFLIIERTKKAHLPRLEDRDNETTTVVVEVKNIKEFYLKLRESGADPSGVRARVGGGAGFYVFDPFGNRIEIFSKIGM
jgi:ADP-ribosylglycohydrolase